MGILYRVVKNTYRTLFPRSLNKFIFGGENVLSRIVLRLKAMIERGAAHNELYDEAYFARQDSIMAKTGMAVADSIVTRLPHVRSVVDVGCGSGAILAKLVQRDITGVGLEYADAAIAICRRKGLDVRKFDIEQENQTDLHADLVLSTEVAEHLPAERADAYVDLLVRTADIVLMTAATPGQGGTDHVNEQPNEYWIEKFSKRGFRCDAAETLSWREDWHRRGVRPNRARNVMCFRRTTVD